MQPKRTEALDILESLVDIFDGFKKPIPGCLLCNTKGQCTRQCKGSRISRAREFIKQYEDQLLSVRIRGKVYSTVRQAAEELDVSTDTIYSAVSRGREDTIGLGSGGTGNKGNSKKVTILGHTFNSRVEASLHVGKNKDYMKHLIYTRGWQFTLERMGLLLMKKVVDPEQKEWKDRAERDNKTRGRNAI